jgi:hypothetical protein
MSLAIRCPVCSELLAPSIAGRREHMKRWHGVRITADKLVPMDPIHKAAIIRRVEDRLGSAIVYPDKRRNCEDCGPTQAEGFTRDDGAFLCEVCLGVRARS